MDQESLRLQLGYLCFFVTLVAVPEKELPMFDFDVWKLVAQGHLVTTGLVKTLSLIFFVHCHAPSWKVEKIIVGKVLWEK